MHSDFQLLINSKAYLIATALIALLGLSQLFSAELLSGLICLVACAVLYTTRLKLKSSQDSNQSHNWLKASTSILLALVLLGLWLNITAMQTWLYIVPLLVFFCFDFRAALWYVGIFSIISITLLNSSEQIFETIQIELNYILFLGIACSLVYLREVRRRQLKPLRRTDNLTKAATKEHLNDDLTKEIQRSEREGSELATIALAIDPLYLSKLSEKDQDTLTINIGKLLHNNLRLFDSYYLWDSHEFLVVLPHTSSAQAVKIANSLRVKVRREISINNENITISAGVSGLNVDDTVEELTSRAAEALRETQSKGNNHTLLYREQTEEQDNADNGSKDS